jgi:hypothetical protein
VVVLAAWVEAVPPPSPPPPPPRVVPHLCVRLLALARTTHHPQTHCAHNHTLTRTHAHTRAHTHTHTHTYTCTLNGAQGFYVFIRALQLLRAHNQGVVLVGLGGASGSGKTAFSEKVRPRVCCCACFCAPQVWHVIGHTLPHGYERCRCFITHHTSHT